MHNSILKFCKLASIKVYYEEAKAKSFHLYSIYVFELAMHHQFLMLMYLDEYNELYSKLTYEESKFYENFSIGETRIYL